ncbi:hypothetical protein BAMA_02640 [Bacillus manliponensis]|uniref:Group-specific protein n=1 Tax=Bacillus manliponensis TaxID=574376 RepID=A0A073JXR3_9BACI|nr:hypothetical protein [Bacillus manliponensis]KEK18987.1 hypothetical protein BAMA_02640 [Bacillus manliponensis]
MSHSKVNKTIYLFVHFIFPVTLFALSTIWGVFFSAKSISTNIVDNLCIMAIYYVLASIAWFFYFNRLQKNVEAIVQEVRDE